MAGFVCTVEAHELFESAGSFSCSRSDLAQARLKLSFNPFLSQCK
jgi:hypothetical protein